jgi:rhamnose utilization protein RhaD (predicted bifunctional aldolase and dehydrogenase)/NAD(P)-dependent dehydrogenase (short-subunit alcohol dehydrogenase family)
VKHRWSERALDECVARYAPACGRALAERTYSSRLLGAEPALVLHGGGNTSVKSSASTRWGERVEALFVKASGHDLGGIEPEAHVGLDLERLRRLRRLEQIDDAAIADALRAALCDPRAAAPSIEAPVHALLPGRFVDHTHADAVLALTNQPDGEARTREALGDEVVVLPYLRPGIELAQRAAEACEAHPQARAMVWLQHGIVTWGETARESYDCMIELVTRAEERLERGARRSRRASAASVEQAEARLARAAPVARGLLAARGADPDRPFRRVLLSPLIEPDVLALVDAPGAREWALRPPLTADHLIRTKALPAWVDAPAYDDPERLRRQLEQAVQRYAAEYAAYLERHASRMPAGVEPFDPLPRVLLLPGLGALCAGRDAREAGIARDITAQTLAAKGRIAAGGGTYRGLDEQHLFDMEYRTLQLAKLTRDAEAPLAGNVVLVTGAAGAIGSGICQKLCELGAHVVVTDLEGGPIDELVEDLDARFPQRALGVSLDVTRPESVAAGFEAASRTWGGVDQVVINAGLAHVSGLAEMDIEDFARVERVNTHGTLLLLQAAARHFETQATGGDIVLISTKNVFAPGARFGAYSASKAAAHQLARVASLELAAQDVRVNMVAPDAVFSHGARPSGLWQEVGPDRMRARNLDPEGLRAYYRERNLLKVEIRADHVANAVAFFLTRETPTTGVTLPVDGGLPDATPR